MLSFDSFILYFWLIVFLLLVGYETKYAPNRKSVNKTLWKLPKKNQIILFSSYLLLLVSVFFRNADLINSLFIFAFSFAIIAHSFWLAPKFGKKALLLPFLIIGLRTLFPSDITHNLLVVSAIAFVSPFLKKEGILSNKAFLIVSLLWFLYDIVYVWLTPLAESAAVATQAIGFPLAIVSGYSSIGSADLLWASLLIALINRRGQRYLTIAALVLSDFLLGLYILAQNEAVLFPLLVLWVPVGILVNLGYFFKPRN